MPPPAASDDRSRAPRPERCARCDAPFECGVDAASCWCASLPALDELPPGLPARCLCPRCLAELVSPRAPKPRC